MNEIIEKSNTIEKPLVAIVGRPNVGKSTLFNRIIEYRKSIVEDIPGVTRDRIYADAVWRGKLFSVVDTGGLEPNPKESNQMLIKQQVELAIDDADIIIFLLDGKSGLTPQDIEIIDFLRKTDKKVIYVINKIDHEKHDQRTFDFHALGIDTFINISALHNRNTYELLDQIINNMPYDYYPEFEESDQNRIKIAVIGKPNVGKSTLVNNILGENRLITSPIPGTTRDSIDSELTFNDKDYLLIDTAGIRRKSRITYSLEKYSVLRALRSISRSDIILFLIDSVQGPTHQDARLADLIHEKGKAVIIILNKWDLTPKEIRENKEVEELTIERLKALNFAPVIKISALTGKNVNKIFTNVEKIYKNYCRKISTKVLNNFLAEIKRIKSTPSYKGQKLRMYYISQIMNKPPTFIIFTNAKGDFPENYKRFIQNQLRKKFDFFGTPIKTVFKTREEEK